MILCIESLFISHISRAQEVSKRYVVITYVSSRSFGEDSRIIKRLEKFYWVFPLDSLKRDTHENYIRSIPVYLPSIETQQSNPDYYYAEDNINGILDNTPIEAWSCFPSVWSFVNMTDRHRVLVQSIRAHYHKQRGRINRKKDKTDVYLTPVLGCFKMIKVAHHDGSVEYMCYPIRIDKAGMDIVTEQEKKLLFFCDYNTQYGRFISTYNYNYYDKAFWEVDTTPSNVIVQ